MEREIEELFAKKDFTQPFFEPIEDQRLDEDEDEGDVISYLLIITKVLW